MKILFINTVYKNGGSTGRIVYDLRNLLLRSEENDAYVVYGYEFKVLSDEDYVNTYKMCSIFQMQWSKIKTRLFAHHAFYNIQETKRMLAWIDRVKPDLIHLHNLHNHYINVKLLFDYIKEKKIPIVWTLHDCWSFTGWCSHFDYAKCYKWKTKCNHCQLKHDYPFTCFFDRSSKNFQEKKECFQGVENLTIVTPSTWLAELVKQSFLKEYPVKVINNGVDLDIFKPSKTNSVRQKYGIKERHVVLALFNVFSKYKGTDYLIKLTDYLTDDEVLVVVGLNKKDFHKLPKKHCLGIEHTDSIQELAAIYSLAEVFVNPTLQDTFPTTNLEALACGTPIVTFRTGGSVESVTDQTGIVVEQNDMDGLLSAIRTILRNGKEQYTDACRKKAELEYNKNIQYGKYIDLYKQLTKTK